MGKEGSQRRVSFGVLVRLMDSEKSDVKDMDRWVGGYNIAHANQ